MAQERTERQFTPPKNRIRTAPQLLRQRVLRADEVNAVQLAQQRAVVLEQQDLGGNPGGFFCHKAVFSRELVPTLLLWGLPTCPLQCCCVASHKGGFGLETSWGPRCVASKTCASKTSEGGSAWQVHVPRHVNQNPMLQVGFPPLVAA